MGIGSRNFSGGSRAPVAGGASGTVPDNVGNGVVREAHVAHAGRGRVGVIDPVFSGHGVTPHLPEDDTRHGVGRHGGGAGVDLEYAIGHGQAAEIPVVGG